MNRGQPPEIINASRLHLGSGPIAASGWANVDKSYGPWFTRHPRVKRLLTRISILSSQQGQVEWPAEVRRMDITKGFPWADESVDVIYSSHMLEHFNPEEARECLDESLRVLKPGGLFRIALPDLRGWVDTYLQAKGNGDPRAADRFVESLMVYPEKSGRRVNQILVRLIGRPHLWLYDAESAAAHISDAGFTAVEHKEYQQGDCPDLDVLEVRPDSFFIEARKPA